MEHITSENILLIGSVLLIAGVLIGKSSYRIGLPLLFIFLIVGMLFGTDGLGIQFSDMHTAQFIGMIALCVILFSGGMGTKLSAIRPVIVPGLLLSTVGVLLTALLTGLFIWWLSGMQWTNLHFAFLPSLLLASTMSSTDSASVFGFPYVCSHRRTRRQRLSCSLLVWNSARKLQFYGVPRCGQIHGQPHMAGADSGVPDARPSCQSA